MAGSLKTLLDKSRAIDRGLDRHVEKFSRFIWPWRERWLLAIIGILVVLDFTSTYIVLEIVQKPGVYESGLMAVWALSRGGPTFLLLVDVIAALVLSSAALAARYLYARRGFKGYSRAAFVFLLSPYIVIASIAIVNNTVLLFQ